MEDVIAGDVISEGTIVWIKLLLEMLSVKALLCGRRYCWGCYQ